MMVTTSDFPQADRLVQVGRVATAISKGKHADGELEQFIGLDSGGRQGRYYRLAAEILGLTTNAKNHAELTSLGTEFTTLRSDSARLDFLSQCLIETPVFRLALIYIQQHQPTDTQLRLWFKNLYPGAETTAVRRFATFFSYLSDSGLVAKRGQNCYVKKYVGAIARVDILVPASLRGKPSGKTIANAPAFSGRNVIPFEVSAQKRERANHTHWKLVAAKSEFLLTRDFSAMENSQIDLYSHNEGSLVIYEMKSVESDNLHAQARKAISQLYEYRYIFGEPAATLCIVTNARAKKDEAWLVDYLAKDRAIAYEWTDDFVNFHCDNSSLALLGDFAP